MIKYHDNTVGPMYGEDHYLSNNWNPDADYGNEYVNIHFRIETKGFEYPSFHLSEEDRLATDEDIRRVFTQLGWTCEKEYHNGSCSTWKKGKAHLYLHPQDFSGEVLKNDVKTIAEALQENPTFMLRWVDLYDTSYDVTDEVFEAMLSERDKEIRKYILDNCQTKRRNRYKIASEIAWGTVGKYRICRAGDDDGRNYGQGKTWQHIWKIIHSLIEEGYLVRVVDADTAYIRTINKTEQREKKLYIA